MSRPQTPSMKHNITNKKLTNRKEYICLRIHTPRIKLGLLKKVFSVKLNGVVWVTLQQTPESNNDKTSYIKVT